MNLIEENFENKEEDKKKKTKTIILVSIVLVFIIIVVLFCYLMYLKSTVMTLTIDGTENEKLKKLFLFKENGSIYAPIKEIASYLGYESYNGEYSDKSEEQSKCYVINDNEVANFELGESKIYKLDLTQKDNSSYEYIYIKDKVKSYDGVLCVSTEGLEKAFNISFDYNQEKNTITIWTLPKLYEYYSSKALDYGYTELSNVFVNQKAILNNQLIVVNSKKQYGVIGVDGKPILEAKYDNITYLTNTGDFLVENNKKVGIISSSRETKVLIIYDSIEVMDSDAGLYLVKKDDKYGIIDSKGNIKIPIENDEIGVDISKFSQNNIKNKYILSDNLIPARKDKYWALYDKNGNQLTEYKYDSLGYIASNNKEAINLLVIPEYNVLVACKDKKYTLVNSSGQELFGGIIADDIYMTISGGETHYYIIANNKQYDAEEYLDSLGVKTTVTVNNQNQNTNSTNTNSDNNSKNENKSMNVTTDQEAQNNNNNENNNNDNNNEE